MIYHETGSVLHSSSKKLKRNWIGPLRIPAILDDTHYLVSDWTCQLIPKRIHFNRLKSYVMNLGKINEEGILETATNRLGVCKLNHFMKSKFFNLISWFFFSFDTSIQFKYI